MNEVLVFGTIFSLVLAMVIYFWIVDGTAKCPYCKKRNEFKGYRKVTCERCNKEYLVENAD